jgi:hypothetical protein
MMIVNESAHPKNNKTNKKQVLNHTEILERDGVNIDFRSMKNRFRTPNILSKNHVNSCNYDEIHTFHPVSSSDSDNIRTNFSGQKIQTKRIG